MINFHSALSDNFWWGPKNVISQFFAGHARREREIMKSDEISVCAAPCSPSEQAGKRCMPLDCRSDRQRELLVGELGKSRVNFCSICENWYIRAGKRQLQLSRLRRPILGTPNPSLKSYELEIILTYCYLYKMAFL